MGPRATIAGFALAWAGVAGCGGPAAPPSEDPLSLAREAAARGDEAGLLRHLEAAEAGSGEAGRVATTWRLRRALAEGDPVAALPRLRRLVEAHAGKGLDPEGRAWPADLLAEALARAATARARADVEGPTPDPAGAARALAAGREALDLTGADDPEGAQALRLADAYLALSDGPLGPRLEAAGLPLLRGPRVLVVADTFEWGEPVLPSVLRRWGTEVPVSLAGRARGEVRRGMRRVAATAAQERAAFEEAARGVGARLEGVLDEDACDELGLDPDGGAHVLVVGSSGRLEGRVSGRALDPRALDDLVRRLAGR